MGRPVVHWELMSEDPAKVSAFYEKIFGWKIEHVPDLSYRMVETSGEGGINGGIGQPCFSPLLRKSHQLSAEGMMR